MAMANRPSGWGYSKVMEAGAPVHQITNQSGGFGPCRPSSSSWIAMCVPLAPSTLSTSWYLVPLVLGIDW
uniref:Uncharacterized protein n=1 Tax=Oryza sativa subsp. japonica TaxID=39947 RepID=Q6ZL28_ORYSJ|nr:hypothetical protein [Oryza sativa Japonica Group]BAD31872.1 hypothetical protein [Oryza sativa Japonica Group]